MREEFSCIDVGAEPAMSQQKLGHGDEVEVVAATNHITPIITLNVVPRNGEDPHESGGRRFCRCYQDDT